MSFLDAFKYKSKKSVAQAPQVKVVIPEASAGSTDVISAANDQVLLADRILLRPVFSEKSDRLKASGQYTFAVAKSANKASVAQAIKALYGVKPVAVHMINRLGKAVRFGKFSGTEKNSKHAIVTLAKGKTISFGV